MPGPYRKAGERAIDDLPQRSKEVLAMGRVNWLAVILAAIVAIGLRIVWERSLAGRANGLPAGTAGETAPATRWLRIVLPLVIGAAMLGHMFARLSPGKPWLYFMMSGGVALTFIAPALWLAYGGRGIAGRETVHEGGYWLIAYLAMGAVFWALR